MVFIPASYAAAYYAFPLIAVALGVVYLVARVYYFRAYIADPEKRAPGMMLTVGTNVVLIGMALVGAVRSNLI